MLDFPLTLIAENMDQFLWLDADVPGGNFTEKQILEITVKLTTSVLDEKQKQIFLIYWRNTRKLLVYIIKYVHILILSKIRIER